MAAMLDRAAGVRQDAQGRDYYYHEDGVTALPPRAFAATAFISMGRLEQPCDLNVLTMDTSQSIAELRALRDAGLNVTHLELGNEFYLNSQCRVFPNASTYALACLPVVRAARSLFPQARIAVVASTAGQWNRDLSRQDELMASVDAVTMHHYGPGVDAVLAEAPSRRRSFIAADGELMSDAMAAEIRRTFFAAGHIHLALWQTEYNYPTKWFTHPSQRVPSLYEQQGALLRSSWRGIFSLQYSAHIGRLNLRC